jgi:pyruvate/2-oxoglutarate dehydrogenase complex dihydrolipoamide acyltransferase (E2) component
LGNRRLVAASVAVSREQDTIHLVTEVDITEARALIAVHRERTGERLSLTAHVVACLARTCAENPVFNSFRKGRRLVMLDDVTISVLFERDLGSESLPDAVAIQAANRQSYREIHDAVRRAQGQPVEHLGSSMGMGWIRFVPDFLLKPIIRWASRSIAVKKRSGVVGVTAIGMHGSGPLWPVPLSSATVLAAVGTVVPRLVLVDGVVKEREHLCVTLSFDHDVIDGAPAARFTRRFSELMSSADELRAATSPCRPAAV